MFIKMSHNKLVNFLHITTQVFIKSNLLRNQGPKYDLSLTSDSCYVSWKKVCCTQDLASFYQMLSDIYSNPTNLLDEKLLFYGILHQSLNN